MWKFVYWLSLVGLVLSNNCFTNKPIAHIGFCVQDKDNVYVGDFDGNGSDDLLCHNSFSGSFKIRYSAVDPFHRNEWSGNLGWCKSTHDQILIGDFNGDGRSDVLCHNRGNGYKTYAFANNDGHITGTSFKKAMRWCTHGGSKLYVGDFNGDGKDDIMCHDTINRIWLAFANAAGHIHGTSVHKRINSCSGVPLVGYFDKDKRADVLCINIGNGVKRILRFDGSNFHQIYDNSKNNNRWCTGSAFARAADVNGDGVTDLICKTYQSSAPLWVMKNKAPFHFKATDYHYSFCHVTSNSRFLVGDFDGNGKKDFACRDGAGHVQVSLSGCQ